MYNNLNTETAIKILNCIDEYKGCTPYVPAEYFENKGVTYSELLLYIPELWNSGLIHSELGSVDAIGPTTFLWALLKCLRSTSR